MLQKTIFRKVLKDDNEALAIMIRNVFDEHNAPHKGTVYSDPTTDDLYQLFQKNNALLWVAEFEERAIGCCGLYPTNGLDSDCIELVKFYIGRKARGKGIGKKLMQLCVDDARSMGYRSIYIESLPEFSKAVRIYEKQGFSILDQPLGNSGHDGCDIWMVKNLD